MIMTIAEYFKQKEGFKRFFVLLKKKYISLGKYSGVVTIDKLTVEEAETLSNFFGVHYEKDESLKTSLKKNRKKIKRK